MFKAFRTPAVQTTFAICVGLFLGVSVTKAQQIPQGLAGKKITLSHYEGVAPRALITAKDAKPLPGGNVLALDFALTTFRDGNPSNIEAVIEAPECVVNIDTHLTWSTNRLHLHNTDTNLFIEGRGFAWQPGPTNILTISNDVHTIIQRVTNSPVKNEGALHIYSDRFKFLAVLATNANTRIAYYTHNVRAEDPEFRLTSESLTADLSSTNNVKNIVAEKNVVIVNKTDNSRAKGDRAIYVNEEGQQLVELTGDPEWHDAKNEGRARRFLFDRNSRMVWLEGDAQMKLPRSSVAQPDFLGLNDKKPATKTNDSITVSAEVLNIDLATNKSGRVLTAKTNVVILADNTRATADGASFSEVTGMLRLTNGIWGGDQFTAKGQLLTFDRNNKVFHSERDAYLKIPAKSFGEGGGGTKKSDAKEKKAKHPDDRAIEIFSDEYNVTTNVAVFLGTVHASFPAETNGLGNLTCDKLTVQFLSNKVEMLIAEGHVELQQKKSSTTNNVNQQVTCDELTVKLFPNGTTKLIIAEHNVIAQEISIDTKTKKESRRKLSANVVTMNFSATTNQLEKMVADKNVYIENDGSWAQADQLVYNNLQDKEVAELNGFSSIMYLQPGRRPISNTDPEGFIWDFRRDVIKAKSLFKAHSGSTTNATAQPKR